MEAFMQIGIIYQIAILCTAALPQGPCREQLRGCTSSRYKAHMAAYEREQKAYYKKHRVNLITIGSLASESDEIEACAREQKIPGVR